MIVHSRVFEYNTPNEDAEVAFIDLEIDDDHVDLYIRIGVHGIRKPLTSWNSEEVNDDPDAFCAMATAVHLFHVDPNKLLRTINYERFA